MSEVDHPIHRGVAEFDAGHIVGPFDRKRIVPSRGYATRRTFLPRDEYDIRTRRPNRTS